MVKVSFLLNESQIPLASAPQILSFAAAANKYLSDNDKYFLVEDGRLVVKEGDATACVIGAYDFDSQSRIINETMNSKVVIDILTVEGEESMTLSLFDNTSYITVPVLKKGFFVAEPNDSIAFEFAQNGFRVLFKNKAHEFISQDVDLPQ